MGLDRRQFLQWAGIAPLMCQSPVLFASANQHPFETAHRSLKLRNLHTGETANVTYWEQGEYLIDGLADIYLLMRDHRQNTIAPIDIRLLDQLHQVQLKLDCNREIMMVSGYRSPSTNKQLREHSNGVAKHSLHMSGKAMDFRIPGLNLRHVHKATLASSVGGVGYYSRGGYIHMDTGRKRHWSI